MTEQAARGRALQEQQPAFSLAGTRAWMVPDPVQTGWGTPGLPQAIFHLIRCALERESFDYFQLLSGTCLPLASAVQAQLAMVNVNLDVESMEPSAWVQQVGAADFVTSYNDTGCWANRSPLTYYFQLHTGLMYNRENTNIDRVNEITELGMRTTDPAEREELYAELLEIISEQAINCPLFQRQTFVTTTKGLVVYPEQMMLPIYMFDTEWVA